MGSDEDKKKLNDDLVEFVSKRIGADTSSRYVSRLKSYVDMQHKRQRAVIARRFFNSKKESSDSRKKNEGDLKDKTMGNRTHLDDDDENAVGKRDSRDTNSRSEGPCDRCGRRRRRRRRRSCCRRRRRRRRRRSCRRRRRRRRRRSCSRRRRRRSCRRRRRRRRRRRC